MFGKRILILAAHPDDEVVACAIAAKRAQAQGASLAVLYLTHGCLARDVMWPWDKKNYEALVARRLKEASAAAKLLNLEQLGCSTRAARQLWPQLPQAFAEAQEAVQRYRPDQIWVPAYEGGNPDHDALNAIGAKLKSRISVIEFAEYNFFGSRARSQTFISPDETTHVISLTSEERAEKRAALDLYASEKGNLSTVRVEQESFRPLAVYDYQQPPHRGTLWYARFQWVPFRHPRVDFTDPRQISDAIASFLR